MPPETSLPLLSKADVMAKISKKYKDWNDKQKHSNAQEMLITKLDEDEQEEESIDVPQPELISR